MVVKRRVGRIVILTAITILLTSGLKDTVLEEELNKGVALAYGIIEDINNLEADWYYVYGVSSGYMSDSRYVPMLVECEPVPALPQNYDDYVLVCNEPDWYFTGGHPVEPEVALSRWMEDLEQYPNAKFVFGNVSHSTGLPWVIEFLELCPDEIEPDIWGVHGYIYDEVHFEAIKLLWTTIHILTGTPLWITETNSPFVNPQIVRDTIVWAESKDWIERIAVFTNRIEGSESWWPSPWDPDMALIKWETGEISATGKAFMGVYELYLPLVIK